MCIVLAAYLKLFCYRLFWYLDPSVLTTLALMGLVATICDYAICLFGSYARHPEQGDKWTGKDEKKLEEVCHSVVSTQATVVSSVSSFFQMRTSRTKTVGCFVLFSCLTLSRISTVFESTIHCLCCSITP